MAACTKCGNLCAATLCSGCHAVSYCSAKCQQADWKEHNRKCSELSIKFASVPNALLRQAVPRCFDAAPAAKPRSPPQPHVQQELCTAIQEGIVGAVQKSLVVDGADPSVPGPDDPLRTPVYLAVLAGNVDVAKTLLQHNGNPNQGKVDAGITPICAAVVRGSLAMVKVLLEHKADPNPATGDPWDNTYQTPMCIAAELGQIELVKALLVQSHSATPSHVKASNNSGNETAPVFHAAWNSLVAGARTLLRGSTPEPADPTPCLSSPLYKAAERGHLDVVKFLLDHNADPNKAKTADGVTPLFVAAQNGCIPVAKTLLEYGADPNLGSTPDLRTTPIYVAAQNSHSDLLKVLLAHNGNPNLGTFLPGIGHTTPLYNAAYQGFTNCVEVLLAHSADPNQATTGDGTTPLFVGVQHGHGEVVRLLLEHNADPSKAPPYCGTSPLYSAAYYGRSEIVKMLLARNADPTQARRADGADAMAATVEHGHVDVLQVLLAHTADPR